MTEIEVEAAPVDAPDKVVKVKIVKATADVNPAEAELEPVWRRTRRPDPAGTEPRTEDVLR